MLFYNVVRSNVLPVTATDFLGVVSAATRSLGIVEIDAEGAGVTSAYTELGIYRVTTAGVTGGAGITPAPLNPAQPAAGFSAFTTWGTQPVLAASPFHNIPLNSNGQRYYWKANTFQEVLWSPGGAVAAGSISVRPISINGNVTVRLKFGEI